MALERQAHDLLGIDYVPLSSSHLVDILGQGVSWGARQNGTLIGIRLVNLKPALSEWSWDTYTRGLQVAEFIGLVVHKDWIRMGVATALNRVALEEISASTDAVVTTVGLENRVSQKVLEDFRFRRVGREVLHSESQRFVYLLRFT